MGLVGQLPKKSSDYAEAAQPRRHRPDYWLLIISIALLVVGLVVIYSISPALGLANSVSSNYYITRQIFAIILSFIAFIVASRIPYQSWQKWYKPLLIVAAAATLLAIIIPVNPAYPAHRWVRLGSLSFQSVELVKFAIIVWLATLLSERITQRTINDTKSTLKPLLITLVLVAAIVAGVQSDLGSTGVIVVIMGALAYVAGLPLKRLAMVVGVIGIMLVLAISITPYRRERLMTFFAPDL